MSSITGICILANYIVPNDSKAYFLVQNFFFLMLTKITKMSDYCSNTFHEPSSINSANIEIGVEDIAIKQ